MDYPDIDDRPELLKHLLSAADRCAVDEPKTLCENSLCKSLVENVVNTFALADQHNGLFLHADAIHPDASIFHENTGNNFWCYLCCGQWRAGEDWHPTPGST
ncbi:hypothetical protein E2562_032082 [Oryza meyeriana var. granulata]|uniref:Uncharacterized protein n=1 Tax=Oryza meyeriana var. granulata TaxID=110450 RepID=A0A6G1CL41_9ORYZ|nr:hypothetical protein E2562_032082 [Oryza meyeriana var. granulata]